VEGDEGQMRIALREIERMLGEAAESGVPVERWIEQFVEELRAAFPEPPDDGRSQVPLRILSDPRQSIIAQARLDPAMLRALRNLVGPG
jgi:hypothetical protein